MTTIQLFAHARPAQNYESGPQVIDGHRIDLFRWDDMKAEGYALIGPCTIEFEFPRGWDPTAQQIDALNQREEKLTAEFHEAVTKIHAQISKLQAICYTPEAA